MSYLDDFLDVAEPLAPGDRHWERSGDCWFLSDPDMPYPTVWVSPFDDTFDEEWLWGSTYEVLDHGSWYHGKTFTLVDRYRSAKEVRDLLTAGALASEHYWVGPEGDVWTWQTNGFYTRAHDKVVYVIRRDYSRPNVWRICCGQYSPCHRAFESCSLAMEHANFHLDNELFEPGGKECEAHRPGAPNDLDHMWPEFYRDTDAWQIGY